MSPVGWRIRCDGTWTKGAAAPIAVRTTSGTDRASSATRRQNVSAASRYWACLISSLSRSRDTVPLATGSSHASLATRARAVSMPQVRRVASVEVVGDPVGYQWAIGVGNVVDHMIAVLVHLEGFVGRSDFGI